ncbi:DNA-binding protein [Variovorax guangxiensis]|nr:DNA-binding protein [Variovorax guangxiensis]
MELNPEIRERVIAAANALYEQGGRVDFPRVDDVRRLAKVNMNDASIVMKDWRRQQTATPSTAPIAVPDRLRLAHETALAQTWAEAQDIANQALHAAQAAWDLERAEADAVRAELSAAFDGQAVELETVRGSVLTLEAQATASAARLAELTQSLTAMTERAATAEARAVEIERRADDLRVELDHAHEARQRSDAEITRLNSALSAAQDAVKVAVAELETERRRHVESVAKLEGVSADLATARANSASDRALAAKAQAGLEAANGKAGELAQEAANLRGRLDAIAASAELAQTAVDAANARAAEATREAATLRGRLEAMEANRTELLQALGGAQPSTEGAAKTPGSGGTRKR